jgi:hypothetical protein
MTMKKEKKKTPQQAIFDFEHACPTSEPLLV